jgi:hypothetical protein
LSAERQPLLLTIAVAVDDRNVASSRWIAQLILIVAIVVAVLAATSLAVHFLI